MQTWYGGIGQGLVYGGVTIQRVGTQSVIIKPDKYNFEMHPWNSFGEIMRNLETIGADFLHGSGTPFWIIFKGRNHIK